MPSKLHKIEAKLDDFNSLVDEIIGMFGVNGVVEQARVAEAQAKLHTFKDDLKSEYKRLSKAFKSSHGEDLEEIWYSSAIKGAWAGSGISGVRADTRPNSRWYEALSSAHVDFSHALFEVRRALKK